MPKAQRQSCGPILVPTDFSHDSLAALDWAIRLAKCIDARILVLHVVHDPANEPGYYLTARANSEGADPTESLPKIEDAAGELLGELILDVTRRHAEISEAPRLDHRLVVGLPVQRILEVAEEVAADHIVMGSQGRTGMGRLMLGSKAERVVRLANVPVTVIKAPVTPASSEPDTAK